VSGARRVIRGGSFQNVPANARAAYRNDNDPRNRNANQGFRLVRASAPSPRRGAHGRWPAHPPSRAGASLVTTLGSSDPCPPVPVGPGRPSGRAQGSVP